MQPISGISSGAMRPTTAIAAAPPAGPSQAAEAEKDRPRKPVQDTYTPEEKREPSGRYWLGKDEDGRPKVCFDDPAQAADRPEEAEGGREPEEAEPSAEGPDEPSGGEERCTVNTDEVDREIKRLKEKKEELEQKLSTEKDSEKAEQLKKELARVEAELPQKDNDTYRRQHARYTNT